jgi:hypothetical protein
MPKPVRELLRLVHVEQVDLSQIKRIDFEVIAYLRESHPDLYRSLRRAVKSRHRHGEGGDEIKTDGSDGAPELDDIALPSGYSPSND